MQKESYTGGLTPSIWSLFFSRINPPFIYFFNFILYWSRAGYGSSQVALVVKNSPANVGDIKDLGSIPGSEDPLEKEMATHSSILAWRIPWTEEPGGLQSTGSQTWT